MLMQRKFDKELTDILSNDKDITFLGHKIKIVKEGRDVRIEDPLSFGDFPILYNSSTGIKKDCGWNMIIENAFAHKVDYENLSFIYYTSKGPNVHFHWDVFSYKIDKKVNVPILVFPKYKALVKWTFDGAHIKNIETENQEFNEIFTTSVVSAKKEDLDKIHDIFYELTPSMIEKIMSLYHVWDNLCFYCFYKNRIYFIFKDSLLNKTYRRKGPKVVPQIIERLKKRAAIVDILINNKNKEATEIIKEYIESEHEIAENLIYKRRLIWLVTVLIFLLMLLISIFSKTS